MKKVNRQLHVIENRPLSSDIFVLTLGDEQPLPEIKPGQFANILIEPANGALLRRPFSIHDIDFTQRFIKFYIQKKGKGTQQLAKLTHGDLVDVIFPLGNGFTVKGQRSKVKGEEPLTLLVGGGCGVAPLLYLAKTLNQNGLRPTILIGGRSKKNIHNLEDYVKYGNVLIMTEDGSIGDKGLVTEHSVFNQQKIDQIYCCGPEPMMNAVSKIAKEKNISCQISLENMMACGIGACLCCVTKTTEGHKCVCTEGPVFDVKGLIMNDEL
ncbi:MAG: dihydroorotate dehydrogenase electron transfer subunit [Bacteroidales bacterium]|jgi:dihydroorotate dehydrogenase electron transfer subunit|nr:dihydroorotate dehydrogenase electron transfer subunit [Bacteroidales bacterium]